MKYGISDQEYDRLEFARFHLKNILLRRMPEPGIFMTEIAGVGMARRNKAGFSEHRFDHPLVSLLIQGSKETVIGSETHILHPNDILTVCIDMPSASRILQASSQNPLLTFFFHINPGLIRDLMLELNMDGLPNHPESGVFVTNANAEFMEAMLHLASILSQPEHLQLKARMILWQLHFLLLSGVQGDLLRQIYSGVRKNNGELFNAIKYLKDHRDRIVSASELARAANMSESSLYRHFKTLTGLTPLQYHKQLRLHKARELIMTEHEQAARAAYRVGYESVSQFGREYKKMFGISPKHGKK